MSVRIMGLVWADKEIGSPIEIVVMLALADFCDDNGHCWPGWATIAEKARVSRATVARVIKSMTAQKKIAFQSGGGRHRTNKYSLTLKPYPTDTVSQGDKTVSHRDKTVSQGDSNGLTVRPQPSGTIINHQEPSARPASGTSPGGVRESGNTSLSPFEAMKPDQKPQQPSVDLLSRIPKLHALYCEVTNRAIRCLAHQEASWVAWINCGFGEDDLRLVVRSIHNGIKNGSRNPGALKFHNLIGDLDGFQDDLAQVKAMRPKPAMNANRASVLRATGRSGEPPSKDAVPMAVVLAGLRNAVGLPPSPQ